MTMEKRLMETESVLCALMTQVSDDQLFSAFSQPSNSTALDLVKTPQFGPVYWGNYPLKSAQDVKRWFKARASITADVAQSQRPRSIGVDLQESEGTHSGTDECHENDFDETDDTVGMIAIEAGQAERKGRQTTSRSSDDNVVQEDAASAAAHLGLARQSLTVASNMNASSAAPRISPEPEDHESYESAFLW
ncbi:hypothetical protein LY78DRAFT_657316 [Colletotrichum sublineola]|uniref:Uncharacterized protein n=1 Tax=Colletotrichum sublineola TaxID=1173701 RepID=A0A066X662_COLSU|nr:hypothetical protein LY78DRAFT_657316 [Colletotrichum sublineola]KDN61201.1 hypothetical protein CSUB01_08213 [Colletotrichum sublineola]